MVSMLREETIRLPSGAFPWPFCVISQRVRSSAVVTTP